MNGIWEFHILTGNTCKKDNHMKMQKWDYRVFQNEQGQFGFIECYYDRENNPVSRSDGFMEPYGEDLAELRKDLSRMTTALNKPVLTEKDFPSTST